MGVKFVELPAEAVARIREFLDHEPPEASADAPKAD
jgi:hypothetical protein